MLDTTDAKRSYWRREYMSLYFIVGVALHAAAGLEASSIRNLLERWLVIDFLTGPVIT